MVTGDLRDIIDDVDVVIDRLGCGWWSILLLFLLIVNIVSILVGSC